MIGNLQIRILGCLWHTNLMIWCVPMSFSEITVCNFGIAWCACVLTHSEPASCYVHTFWAYQVLCAHFQSFKRLYDSVRRPKKALQHCWKAPHVWLSTMHITHSKRSSSQLGQFPWQVHNWAVCFHANNLSKFTNLQCKGLYHCDKFWYIHITSL